MCTAARWRLLLRKRARLTALRFSRGPEREHGRRWSRLAMRLCGWRRGSRLIRKTAEPCIRDITPIERFILRCGNLRERIASGPRRKLPISHDARPAKVQPLSREKLVSMSQDPQHLRVKGT